MLFHTTQFGTRDKKVLKNPIDLQIDLVIRHGSIPMGDGKSKFIKWKNYN